MKTKSNLKNTLAITLRIALMMSVVPVITRAQNDERTTQVVESAKITTSPEFRTFIERYVAAINSKNLPALKECIHPKSVELMEKDNAVANDCISIRFHNPFWSKIEPNYTVFVTPIPADKPLPFAELVKYPARPSHTMRLEWHDPMNSMNSYQQSGVIVKEDGKWFVILTTVFPKNLLQGHPQVSDKTKATFSKAVVQVHESAAASAEEKRFLAAAKQAFVNHDADALMALTCWDRVPEKFKLSGKAQYARDVAMSATDISLVAPDPKLPDLVWKDSDGVSYRSNLTVVKHLKISFASGSQFLDGSYPVGEKAGKLYLLEPAPVE